MSMLPAMATSGMQEPTFLVLTALAAAPKHGYALLQEISESSSGRVRLRTGTLYAALDRLESEGLVRVTDTEVVDGRKRRYYGLTEAGVGRLDEETQRLAANVARARAALRLRAETA